MQLPKRIVPQLAPAQNTLLMHQLTPRHECISETKFTSTSSTSFDK